MKILNLDGYMLGNDAHIVVRGDAWMNADSPVYICNSVDVANEILHASHRSALEPNNVVWSTIYRVRADEIEAFKIENGLIWTTQATKITVDKPVAYHNPPHRSEAQLLANAQQMLPYFSKLIRGKKK
ncbi:MAG: hypothetical protein J6L47_00465 [Alphaproteobacteria bacterium]|nr:hypothetical protein [Alphaproteobacteria bacterium]